MRLCIFLHVFRHVVVVRPLFDLLVVGSVRVVLECIF